MLPSFDLLCLLSRNYKQMKLWKADFKNRLTFGLTDLKCRFYTILKKKKQSSKNETITKCS